MANLANLVPALDYAASCSNTLSATSVASCSVALKRMCEVLSFYLSGFEGHLIATEDDSLSYGDLGILPFYRNGDGIGTADVTGLVTPSPARDRRART